MKRKDLLLIGLFLASPAIAAESEVLREIMGEKVYRQSGVESLSEEQIKILEQWMLEHAEPAPGARAVPEAAVDVADGADGEAAGTAGVASISPEPPRNSDDPDQADDVIRSRIDGRFEGWRNDDTRFHLQNGQIWEQRQPATFITDLDSPEVIIRKTRFGHTMEVPAIDRKLHVKRIR